MKLVCAAMTCIFLVLLQNAVVTSSSFVGLQPLRRVSQQYVRSSATISIINSEKRQQKQQQHGIFLKTSRRQALSFPTTATITTTCTRLGASSSKENNGDSTSLTDFNNQETLATGSHVAEMEIKKSRFIGYAKHVASWKEAQQYIEEIKFEHPKCRHACVGFVCGTNPQQERSNDDGEPTGTAGAPILAAIKGEGLSNVVCIIIRYFGGIKLGAGGLIRAYGGAARLVLRESPKQMLIPTSSIKVQILGQYTGTIYDTVRRIPFDTVNGGSPASVSDEEYNNQGDLTLTVTCETQHVSTFLTNLQDSTKGTAIILNDD